MTDAPRCPGSITTPLEGSITTSAGGKPVGKCGHCAAFVYLLLSGLLRDHKLPRGSEIAAVVTAAEDGSGAPAGIPEQSTEGVAAAASLSDEVSAAAGVSEYDDSPRSRGAA